MKALPFKFSLVDQFIRNRINSNRDAKVIVSARNSETGTGKTTFGVLLAKRWDMNGWDATKGFLDVRRYIAYYNALARSGDVLLLDDAHAGLDNRRSTAKENVQTSKYWTLNRYKNVVTILTLTTQSMLDKRLLELADVWINVRERGLAVPYRITVDDISKKVRTWRFRHPYLNYKEEILFGKYEGCDYKEMAREKDKFVREEFDKDFDEDLRIVIGQLKKERNEKRKRLGGKQ